MVARPILLALPLDHETLELVGAAAEIARALGAPIVVVHAIPRRRLDGDHVDTRIAEARSELEIYLAIIRDAGLVLQDVTVAVGHPAEVVIDTAPRIDAQLIVIGGGRPATVRRWVFGSVAEAVVRQSSVPVWVMRGTSPIGRRLLCPVDLTPQSEVGLEAALRMARLFQMSLSLIAVVSDDSSNARLAKDEPTARKQIEALLAGYDLEGLNVSLTVTSGDPAQRIVDAADDAGLLVIASRGYDPLVRAWLGPVSARVLGHSICSALMIRHLEAGHEGRVRAITRLADLQSRAQQLVADGRGQAAVTLLARAAEQASTNAAVQELYARALEQAGHAVEATSRRELAALIREQLG
ncbi:MAG TPA: universal stress protein [Nannocystaceae bacterium]|nr:universal stress protein [Nannocystaceae bacterium]